MSSKTSGTNVLSRRKVLQMGALAGLYHLGRPFIVNGQQRRFRGARRLNKKLLPERMAFYRRRLKPVPSSSFSKSILVPQPISQEEVTAVEILADEINHAITMVAANPGASYHNDSFARQLQQKFIKLSDDKREAAQKRAKGLLAMSPNEKRLIFGSYADKGIAAHSQQYQRATLNRDVLVKRAVKKRLDLQRTDVKDFIKKINVSKFPDKAKQKEIRVPDMKMEISKTTIYDVGDFSGSRDVPSSVGLKPVITEVDSHLDFKWKTGEVGAERGIWKIFDSRSNKIVAVGEAGMAPDGMFRIEFKKFVPAPPPEIPIVYHVRVYPYPEKKTGSSGRFAAMQNPVGPPSPPLTVTYISAPRVPLYFPDVFRTLKIYTDWIKVIDDQCGSGIEEFHITGFLLEEPKHELTRVPHMIRNIDPAGERKAYLDGFMKRSHLPNPGSKMSGTETYNYPRVYTLCLSVLEEDDGESVNDWLITIWEAALNYLQDAIREIVTKSIGEFIEEYGEEVLKNIINSADLTSTIVDSITSATSASIIGVVVAIVGNVISNIIEGMEDDYYGVGTFVFIVGSNLCDDISKYNPGRVKPNGDFALNEVVSEPLLGPWCPGGAATWDGSVKLAAHIAFCDKEQL